MNHRKDQVPAKRSRRNFVTSTLGAATGASILMGSSPAQATSPSPSTDETPKFRYCLNTSTINGSKVAVRDQIQIAAKAGYDAVELWTRDIQKYLESGGTLEELRKELEDLGLAVDSAIAFGNWIVDDAIVRKQGLEQCKRDMDTVAAIGGTRIAAPPVGATRQAGLDLAQAGERYKELLILGTQTGVLPQLELWGFSKNLSRLEEVLYVAAAAQHPDACLLLDVYHLYKGGSDFSNLGLVPGKKMHCLHMNDYPADPARDEIGDQDRVYPGDGVAPIAEILRTLFAGGFQGTLSLELFNRQYWEQPAQDVARTGLEKMQACVQKAFA